MTTELDGRYGAPARGLRFFGWLNLFGLLALLINNILTVGFGFPGPFSGAGGLSFVQLGLYGLAILAAGAVAFGRPDNGLRWEARRISAFNAYVIRVCFFAVLFAGVADAGIAFLRVEGLLEAVFPPEIAAGMARASWTGIYIHTPLILLAIVVSLFTRTLGFPWLALLIVVAELLIVFSRFIFSYEQALMGDLVRYWYAALFLFASAYTLKEEGHVRVDVLYSGFGRSTKGYANAIGTILLGMTTAWLIIWIGFDGKQSIINSPVANFEVSQSGPAGMYTKYQMAAFIGIFAITMLIEFVAYLYEAVADARGEPGHREHAAVSH
jgi:TRAP-type mannitol/chloroaromatic compound transport system permease small subunit